MFNSKSTGWIGVDVGTHCVKLAQLVRNGSRYEILDAAVVPRQEAWQSPNNLDHPLSSEGEISAARSLANQARGRHTACCTSMAICRCVMVDMDEFEKRPKLNGLEDVLQLSSGNAVISDFYRNPADSAHQSLVFAMQQNWSDLVATDLYQVGLRCQVMDAVPMALARAMKLDDSVPDDELTAVIDWGYSVATVCMVQSGAPLGVRNLPRCGLRHLFSAIGQAVQIDPADAQRILLSEHRRHASSDETAGNRGISQLVHDVVIPLLNEFSREIFRTLEFYRSRHSRCGPSSIRLVGGGAYLPNICDILATYLQLPVAPFRMGAERSEQHELTALLGTSAALSMLRWGAKA